MFEIAGGIIRKLLIAVIAAVLSIACAGAANAVTDGAELKKKCRYVNDKLIPPVNDHHDDIEPKHKSRVFPAALAIDLDQQSDFSRENTPLLL